MSGTHFQVMILKYCPTLANWNMKLKAWTHLNCYTNVFTCIFDIGGFVASIFRLKISYYLLGHFLYLPCYHINDNRSCCYTIHFTAQSCHLFGQVAFEFVEICQSLWHLEIPLANCRARITICDYCNKVTVR